MSCTDIAGVNAHHVADHVTLLMLPNITLRQCAVTLFHFKFKYNCCVVVQSAAQQAEEDAAIAGQVRGEMWGNLQGILSMLAGHGCSPHVQDMLHQIAVHFANEQSQSVALERRLTGNITKEKEAQKRMQQQLQGGIQVSFGWNGCCRMRHCFVFVVLARPRLVLHVPSSS